VSPLLFHSTSYSPPRAQAEIQKQLLGMGARRISLEYDKGRNVSGMSFTLETPAGEQEFLLPARADRVKATLKRQGILRGVNLRRAENLVAQDEHAQAVAWRTLLEWVKLQAALADTNQAEAAEIFLPYLLIEDGCGSRVTVYEKFNAARALPDGQTDAVRTR